MWLRELLTLLDRDSQPSLVKNMTCLYIKQRYEKKIILTLTEVDNKANIVEIVPYKDSDSYIVSIYQNNTPISFHKKVTIDEVKYIINHSTILELI